MLRASVKIVLLVFVSLVLVTQTTFAESRYDEHDDLIRPQAQLTNGTLQRIQNDEREEIEKVIISDLIYTIDERTVFTDKKGKHIGLSSFEVGMTVDFYSINQLLTKMWPSSLVISDNHPPSNGGGEPVEGMQDDVHLDDGVWKN